eukprot:1184334-Lingulodinium_polyedra.AAC.1
MSSTVTTAIKALSTVLLGAEGLAKAAAPTVEGSAMSGASEGNGLSEAVVQGIASLKPLLQARNACAVASSNKTENQAAAAARSEEIKKLKAEIDD